MGRNPVVLYSMLWGLLSHCLYRIIRFVLALVEAAKGQLYPMPCVVCGGQLGFALLFKNGKSAAGGSVFVVLVIFAGAVYV